MYEMMLRELRRFVDLKIGGNAWSELLTDARVTGASLDGPRDVLAIVSAATQVTGKSAGDLLEELGEFLSPRLVAVAGRKIRPEWRTMEVLEHARYLIEAAGSRVGGSPVAVKTLRDGSWVLVTYRPPPGTCQLAVGVVRGLAAHYGDSVTIRKLTCMGDGAESCALRVQKRFVTTRYPVR